MALFKPNKDSGMLTLDRPVATSTPTGPAVGPSAAECLQVGQILVDAGQLTAEALATCLQIANGDLLQFGDIALGRFAAGRKASAG